MNDRTHHQGRMNRPLYALFALAFAALSIAGAPASAAGPGGFTIKTPEVTEKGGEWHVKVRIDLLHPPAMMHSPMRFTFSKEVVDERAIMSKGAEPVHHRVVLDTPAKQIVGLDVDFADASGKVWKSCYFEFDLKRADGYFEAGEYVVGLSGPDGEVGNAQKITLHGDNPPVYRGAMDFTDAKKTSKKGVRLQAVSSGIDAGPDNEEVAGNDKPNASLPSGDVAASGTPPDMIPKSSYDRTPEEEAVHGHGGCGCITAGLGEGAALGGPAAGIAIALVSLRRRRRALGA
jgi:ABC-type amino acid transport substrate-binding protein